MQQNRIRKQIDIDRDDYAALQLLSGRHREPMKRVIEKYLHQLAEVTMQQEMINRAEAMEKKQKKHSHSITNQ